MALLAVWLPLIAQNNQDERILSDQEERILHFDSNITVNDDGSMLVRETIKVQSTGESMKHGIYRGFPTASQSRLGLRATQTFEIVSLTRDGSLESYHVEDSRDGVTVYFGRSDILLPPGP